MKDELDNTQVNNIQNFLKEHMVSENEAGKAMNFKSELKQALTEEYMNSLKKQKPKSILGKLNKNLFSPKFLMAGGAGLLVVLIFSAFFIFSLFQSDSSDEGNDDNAQEVITASITYTEGDVEYNPGGAGWQEAEIDMQLEEGDSLRVLDNGRASVELADGSFVRLNNNSEVTMVTLQDEEIKIANGEGEVYARVVESDERTFDISIEDHNVTSVGTAFRTVNFSGIKGVEVFESKVKASPAESENSLLVPQGNKYYFVNGEQVDLERVLVEIINEELADDDFIIWNKKQDEDIPEFADKLGILEDLQAPDLEILTPANNTKTTNETITVRGTTEEDARIFINEAEVDNNGGNFEYEVELDEGDNDILVEAIDSFGNKTTQLIQVTRELPATPTPPPVQPSIGVSATVVGNGIKFNWTITGSVDTSQGFKILKGTQGNTSLNWDNKIDSYYVSSGNARNATWNLSSGNTYSFRVCTYTGSGCGTLSNVITVTEPTAPSGVTSITLSHVTGPKVAWTIDGTAADGVKVVWSKNANPTYPTGANTQAQYITGSSHAILDAFDGAGTYYVRVCEYLSSSGSCGVYSNQITVDL
ncbi:FecR domain-containing protein [Candidatus Dojkabacteria bacterium]|uniref:FecR domain-containing protein n=1 Tax=Candidatus Dojkabacteria bacterium TaxID=2099670 RepID=A0A955L4S2_9BACT|nr:FecR domain-containing protein [Candidatus Dojkabacteria bacterium]